MTTNSKFLENDFLTNHIPISNVFFYRNETKRKQINVLTNNGNEIQTPYVRVNIPLNYSSGRYINKHITPQVQVPENSL